MIVRNLMTKEVFVVEYDLDKPRERGWPVDCRKCDLYDREKQDCGVRSASNGTPVRECMSWKRYDYLTKEK